MSSEQVVSPTTVRVAPTRVWHRWEWARPVRPVRREVAHVPAGDPTGVPVLFVPGLGDGGAEALRGWLVEAAERGHDSYAVSPRGLGATARPGPRFAVTLREWVHDVVQAAIALPSRCVLVGHGTGGWVVAHALHRYPAAAGAFVDPVGLPGRRFPGVGTLLTRPRLGARLLTGRDPRRGAISPPLFVAAGGDYPAKPLADLAVRYGARSERLAGNRSLPTLTPVLDWLAETLDKAGD